MESWEVGRWGDAGWTCSPLRPMRESTPIEWATSVISAPVRSHSAEIALIDDTCEA